MRRAFSLLAITTTLLVPVVLASCAEPESREIRNVVFIVVDTLRRDHLGAYGYARDTSPAIDALAAEGFRFDRAYATSGWTMPSVSSMLTGRYPSAHGVVRPRTVLAPEIKTLAETLHERGFATAGVVSHRVLGKRWGLEFSALIPMAGRERTLAGLSLRNTVRLGKLPKKKKKKKGKK